MSAITRTIQTSVTYFPLGNKIQHAWFQGEVIGINGPKMLMFVRVTVVIHQGVGRAIGVIRSVPFNCGKEIA